MKLPSTLRSLVKISLSAALSMSSSAVLAIDSDKFANLMGQERMNGGLCRDRRSDREKAQCFTAFGMRNAGDTRVDRSRPGPSERTRDYPRIIAAKLNEANLGLEFRAEAGRVFAELTQEQRDNLGRVFSLAPDVLDRSTGAIEFDVNNQRQLVVLNVYEMAPAADIDNFIRMRNGHAPAFAVALLRGDPAEVKDIYSKASAMRAALPEPVQDAQSGHRGRLAGLLSRLKTPGAADRRDAAPAAPPAPNPAREPEAAPLPAAVAAAPPAVAVANPFDTIRAAEAGNGVAAAAPPVFDALPGLPAAPPGALWADLRSPSDDPELSEMRRIVDKLATPEVFQQLMKPRERAGLYTELATFLSRERTAARQAEIVGRTVIALTAAAVSNNDGSTLSLKEAFKRMQTKSSSSKIWIYPQLLSVLIGDSPPSAEKNTFAPKAAKPNSVDMLFRVYLPVANDNINPVPMDRFVNFLELVEGLIVQRNASGALVPAASGFPNARTYFSELGYVTSGSPGANGRAYMVTLRPKSGEPRVLFDVLEVKTALATSGQRPTGTVLPPR